MGKWRFSIEIVDLPIENGDFPSETPAGMLSSAETSTQISSQTPCHWPSHYPHRKTIGKPMVKPQSYGGSQIKWLVYFMENPI